MERKLAAIFSADVKGYSRLKQAFALAQKAVALDESLPSAHQLLGQVYLFHSQHQQAVAEAERAVALAPNDAEGCLWLGWILNYAGRPEEGITKLEQATRLNPQYPANYSLGLGQGYRVLGRYEEAIHRWLVGNRPTPHRIERERGRAIGGKWAASGRSLLSLRAAVKRS